MSAANAGATTSRGWLRGVLVGLGYFVIGIATAALSRDPVTGQVRHVWRWAAWVLSAALFGAQIWYERVRLRGAAARAALRAALAVAVGGFLLAASATVHSMSTGADRLAAHLVALVAWPLLLAVPAFLVAWAAATALGRKRAP